MRLDDERANLLLKYLDTTQMSVGTFGVAHHVIGRLVAGESIRSIATTLESADDMSMTHPDFVDEALSFVRLHADEFRLKV